MQVTWLVKGLIAATNGLSDEDDESSVVEIESASFGVPSTPATTASWSLTGVNVSFTLVVNAARQLHVKVGALGIAARPKVGADSQPVFAIEGLVATVFSSVGAGTATSSYTFHGSPISKGFESPLGLLANDVFQLTNKTDDRITIVFDVPVTLYPSSLEIHTKADRVLDSRA
jgi:hypothetical protein